jgi:hypothetical protein
MGDGRKLQGEHDMVALTDEVVRAAYARNAAAKMFGGEPQDWVRVAIEVAADLSGIPHLQVTDEMVALAIRESTASSKTGGGGVLDWTRAGLEAALALAPALSGHKMVAVGGTMWLVVYWPQVGDEVAESVWTFEADAEEEAQRLNDEIGPGYSHYGHRPIAFGRPRNPADF